MRAASCHPDRLVLAQGLCRPCYRREVERGNRPLIRPHRPKGMSLPELVEWLDQHLQPPNEKGCRECYLSPNARGYPRVGWQKGGRKVSVARLVLEHTLGRPLRKGEVVRHRCDNTRCCEASHLLPGTQQQNVRDAVERGRMWYQKTEAA